MYSPLNEDYMFQEMNDRIARITVRRNKNDRYVGGTLTVRLPHRTWWSRARLAR